MKNLIILVLVVALGISMTGENPFQHTTDGVKADVDNAKNYVTNLFVEIKK